MSLHDCGPEDLLVVFRVEQQRYALPLTMVDRVVQAVEVTPLPGAPDVVAGVIDVAGRVIPVVDLRRLVGLAGEPIDPDHLFLITCGDRALTLVIDEVQGLEVRPAVAPEANQAVRELAGGRFAGIAALDGALVLIHDSDGVLSTTEAEQLDEAVAKCN